MNFWYEVEPQRLRWELEEFARHGVAAEVSHDLERRLVVSAEVMYSGSPLEIVVTYPHGYPFFPPSISSRELILPRHQHRATRSFCLLEDPLRDWLPWESAGRLVGSDLRRLLRDSERGAEAVLEGEADMAEPVSAMFPYCDRVVLVSDHFFVHNLSTSGGAMEVARGSEQLHALISAKGIGAIDQALLDRIVGDGAPHKLYGRWLALDVPPAPEAGVDGLVRAIDEADSRPLTKLAALARRKPKAAAVLVGITFLEQGPTRDEERRTWLFVDIQQRRDGHRTVDLLRAQAVTREERHRRTPELRLLGDAHVAIIGAGSVGAPLALELAKAGVGSLDVVDFDRYDVNNAVRHVLRVQVAGQSKAQAVARECSNLNPFLDAHGRSIRIGDSMAAEALLATLLETATVVVDSTGSEFVTRYLAARCRAAGTTFIVCGLTSASHGADVFVIGRDGPCLECFLLAQTEGHIAAPPQGPKSVVTPIGCSHPAFSGAGFEATELAALVARAVVRETHLTDYTPSSTNWITVSFRSEPHYREGHLDQHASCKEH